MTTVNSRSYSNPKNLNLKGQGVGRGGLLRFEGTNSSNPFGSVSNGLYINASNQLVYVAQGVSTVLGSAAGGSASAPSLDAIFQGDQTLDLGALSTLTIDRSSGNNDVLTLTNTGAGSGDLIQLTNAGSGKDINGTSGTWSVTKTGVAVFLSQTLSGAGGSTVFTVTAGDLVVSDGSLAITDADNAATFTVTNDTATTASVFVVAGSGAFTGSTTTSFLTITPSGLTSGTAVYLPVAALTTGKALHIVANAATSGLVVNITSSATAITGAGRLFAVNHTGATSTSGILNEFSSAATDETVIVKITASGALATGVALQVSGSSVTTGKAITATDLDALTTGMGLHIASAATAITGAGRLVYVNHTGATGTSAVLAEIASAATDETVVFRVTASAALALGTLVDLSGTAITTGTVLDMGGLDALTTGTALNVVSNSSSASTRILVNLVNDHASATGVTPLFIQNDAVTGTGSKFVKIMAGAQSTKTVTIWLSIDATTPNGNLTGTAGDICLNGPSSVPYYCTGTTNWTALA